MEYWMILTVFIVIALLTDLVASRFAKKVSFNGIKLKSSCESTFMSKHEKRFNIICVFAAMYSVTHFIYLAGGFPKMYYVVQEQFQNQYSAGLNFYIRLFMMIASGNCKFLYESYIDSKSRGVWRSNCINCSGNNRNCYSNYILYIKETIECQTDFCALLEVSLIWKYHAIVCRDIENEVLRRYCFIMRSDLYRRIELCWCFINIKR